MARPSTRTFHYCPFHLEPYFAVRPFRPELYSDVSLVLQQRRRIPKIILVVDEPKIIFTPHGSIGQRKPSEPS